MDSLLADVLDMPKTSRAASKPLGHQPAAPSVSTRSLGDSFDDDDGPNEEPPKRESPVPSLDTAGSDRGSERGASSNTAAAAASSIASVAVGGSGTAKAASSSEPDSGGASRAQPFSKRCASLVSM